MAPYAFHPGLRRVSITGADDKVPVAALRALGGQYPFVEWALLYVPTPGGPRNPTQRWREEFFATGQRAGVTSAVHLCFRESFEQLREGRLSREIFQTDRIQLNINARRVEFSDDEVLGVYRRALDLGPDIILQHQELTAPVIERFLRKLGPTDAPRVHVLLDESRGKGLAPASWSIPTQYAGLPVYVGFAGGIGPTNTQDVLNQVRALMRPYWIDMETSVRTDNAFDVAKVEAVLRAAEPFVAR